MVEGPEAALDMLQALEAAGELSGYPLLAATQADCLRRLARHAEAVEYYRRALLTVRSESEQRFLTRRIKDSLAHG